ncbi:heat-shock protein Hsp20 [Synergistales bacterium]|nr:heat-shock protein Hsp20 [Synergistales bacterium]GHV52580.1 heat-shock protein Hsp20 [Synergistales bacterium]
MIDLIPFHNGRTPGPEGADRVVRDFADIFDRFLYAHDLRGQRNFRDFDLYEKDGKLFLSIEVPGACPDDVEIKTSKNRMSVKSVKRPEPGINAPEDDKVWYNKKKSFNFNYDVALPFEIDPDKAEAAFEHGVIHITAPRLDLTERRVVPIKKV